MSASLLAYRRGVLGFRLIIDGIGISAMLTSLNTWMMLRAKLEVAPSATEAELTALALADPGVQRALDGREVRQVIDRAPKLVSIVPA